MPHLERRYVPSDPEFQAWLFGVLDAVEYLREGKEAGSKFRALTEWLESEVVEYYAEYQQFKKERFLDAKREQLKLQGKREQAKWSHPAGKGLIPLSGGGVRPHRKAEEASSGGSAGARKDSGGTWRRRISGVTGDWIWEYHPNLDAFGERSDGVDRNY